VGRDRSSGRPEKTCTSCGRRVAWRAKWADDWEQVRYCSAACRRRRVRPVDEALERAITTLLARRGRGGTICPSEAARLVHDAEDEGWRDLMEPARRAARRLVAAGEVEITQRSRVVDPSTAKGPIRIRSAR
jgi:hypothetical protein